MSRPSNGTMMHIWLDRWCFACVHDHAASHTSEEDYEHGCEVLARLYVSDHGEPIPEMIEHEELNERGWSPDSYECRLYERCPCQDERGWEPPTAPVPDPNQGVLFEVIDESPGLPMFTVPVAESVVTVAGGVL